MDDVKPHELVTLEQFLRALRTELTRPHDVQATYGVIQGWRDALPEMHAYVRGMLHGL